MSSSCYCLNPLKRVNSILTEAYDNGDGWEFEGLNPLKRVNSILTWVHFTPSLANLLSSLNPLKRVNSILTRRDGSWNGIEGLEKSQSPQTGQFNSYPIGNDNGKTSFQCSLNPLKRVNSILTTLCKKGLFFCLCLNPLKRVNSILTEAKEMAKNNMITVSIPSNGSIQFLHPWKRISI